MSAEQKYPTITGVIESADFGPYWGGENFVTVTFRVPKDTLCPVGSWSLTPVSTNRPEWSRAKDEHP